MPIIYLASQNKHKAAEIQAILGSHWPIHSCDELSPGIAWDENGHTFIDNAWIKAQAVLNRGAKAVLADDSGLEVLALNGAPGIHSARYAGPMASDEDNNRKLLEKIDQLPASALLARFRCVLCYVEAGKDPVYFEGVCDGRLIKAKSGLRGFGYDPLFIPAGYEQTFAELGDAVKNKISHRAKALEKFRAHLSGD